PARGPAAEAPAIAAILHRRPRACQGPPVARSRGRLTVPASPEQYRDRWTGSERWRVDGNPAEGCRRRGDAMELLEALYTTRAMRRMSAREVPDELIPRVLDAAIRAPSGGGFQNWCFIVIRDPTMKAYLGELF